MSESQNEKPMADQISDALMPQQREEMEPPQSLEVTQETLMNDAAENEQETEMTVKPEWDTTTNNVPSPIDPLAAGGLAMMQDAQSRFGDQPPQNQKPANPEKYPSHRPKSTPVSNTTPPPATGRSIQASAESRPQTAMEAMMHRTDERTLKLMQSDVRTGALLGNTISGGSEPLRRFVDRGQTFSINWVRQMLLAIVPEYLPHFPQWKIPGGVQLEKLIYDIATGPGYVESKWGALSVILGDSRDNTEFAAGVLCFLAMADAINVMGRVRAEMDGLL